MGNRSSNHPRIRTDSGGLPSPFSIRGHGAKLAYTIAEFCMATGVGRSSVYLEIAAGRLKTIKVAGRRLILPQDGEAWLKSQA